jgi:hypothetical protein
MFNPLGAQAPRQVSGRRRGAQVREDHPDDACDRDCFRGSALVGHIGCVNSTARGPVDRIVAAARIAHPI